MASTASTSQVSGEAKAVNGLYKFDSGPIRAASVAAAIMLLLGLLITARAIRSFSPILMLCTGVVLALACIASLFHFAKLNGRVLQLTDDGIWIRDRRGNEIGSIQWTELANVTERRKMAQLALWDRSSVCRVLIDGQYENFELIRSRVLDEYARSRVQTQFPMKFSGSGLFCYEAFLYLAIAVGMGFCSWKARQDGAFIPSAGLLCFAALSFVSLLNLYPQLRGPSVVFPDQIMLRSLFRTRQIYKKDVSSVRVGDVANAKSGTRFSLVILQLTNGKQVKINARYGSIPEIYLALRDWLTQK